MPIPISLLKDLDIGEFQAAADDIEFIDYVDLPEETRQKLADLIMAQEDPNAPRH